MTGHHDDLRIPIAISARHAHLCQRTIDALFGPGHQLRPRNPLRQIGQFAAQETVSMVGPHGRIENVRVMGPPRSQDQIEISRTDEMVLGLHDHDIVRVAIDTERPVVFGNVVVRVADDYRLELHLDTDEGNAAGVEPGTTGRILDH